MATPTHPNHTVELTADPAVPVSDERGSVEGWSVWLVSPEHGTAMGVASAIPLEGDSIDCWLEVSEGIVLSDEQLERIIDEVDASS